MATHDGKQNPESLAYRCLGGCNLEVRKPVFCDRCRGAFHPKCANFRKVTHDNKTIKVCDSCLTAANPMTPNIDTRSRTSSTSSTKSTLSTPALVPTAKQSATLDEVLKAIQANTAIMNAFIATQEAKNAKYDAFIQQQEALNSVVNEDVRALSGVMHSNHEVCVATHQALKDHCQKLESENKVLKSQQQLGQQRDAEHDLVITGIPEDDAEDLREIIITAAAIMQVHLGELDIVHAHRIKSTNPNTNQPRFIYVSLESRAKRNLLFAKAKEAPELLASQIRPAFPATRFHVNEWQSASVNSLFRKAKEAARGNNYKYTWFSHGKIRVRRNSEPGTATIIINDEADLAKIT